MKDSLEMTRRSFFLWGFILEVALVGIAVLVSYLFFDTLLLNPITFDQEGVITGLAASLPIVAYFFFSLSAFGRNLAPLERIYDLLKRMLSKALSEMPTWQIVVIGMSAGIGEECLFRGMLQPLVEGWTSPWAAIALTGLFFGLLHALTPAYFILATVLSIYFGFLVNYTGNVLTPILAHGLYDVVALLLLRRLFSDDARKMEKTALWKREGEETAAEEQETDED